MILRTGTIKSYRLWFLPTLGISSCGISEGKIISVNWLLCYRFFVPVFLQTFLAVIRAYEYIKQGSEIRIFSLFFTTMYIIPFFSLLFFPFFLFSSFFLFSFLFLFLPFPPFSSDFIPVFNFFFFKNSSPPPAPRRARAVGKRPEYIYPYFVLARIAWNY